MTLSLEITSFCLQKKKTHLYNYSGTYFEINMILSHTTWVHIKNDQQSQMVTLVVSLG